MKKINIQGSTIYPLLIVLAVVGIISFLLITYTLPLHGVLGILNPKSASHAIVNTNIYWGAFAENVPDNLSGISALESSTGKKVAIISWYQGWAGGGSAFDPSSMDLIRAHGSIPMITWEPWDTETDINPKYALQNITNGNFDSYLTQYAKDSKTWGHPYFLRLAPEMNSDWNSWSEGVNGNQTGDFVKAWKHVHDLFVANNATNVTWVWCPNANFPGSVPLPQLYPGNTYVDWTCIDGYNWGGVNGIAWQSFSQVFKPTYDNIQTISPSKPLMLGEFGSAESGAPSGQSKATWIADTLQTQIPENFPQMKAIIWFDVNKETNWLIDSSVGSLQSFSSGIQLPYYIDNQFANLASSPIRPFVPSLSSPTPNPTRTSSPRPTSSSAVSCVNGLLGDADCDGSIGIFDYSIVVTHFGQTGTNIVGDVNHDQTVDIFDYSLVISNFS